MIEALCSFWQAAPQLVKFCIAERYNEAGYLSSITELHLIIVIRDDFDEKTEYEKSRAVSVQTLNSFETTSR